MNYYLLEFTRALVWVVPGLIYGLSMFLVAVAVKYSVDYTWRNSPQKVNEAYRSQIRANKQKIEYLDAQLLAKNEEVALLKGRLKTIQNAMSVGVADD